VSLVRVADHDHVRLLALNRVEARNALDTTLLGELLDALADAVHRPETRAIVLAGGDDAFSVGADLREDLDDAGRVRRMELFGQVFEAAGTCPLPTVAAVSGHCIGGGAEIAAACDIRIVDPGATFRFPGAAHGIPIGAAKLVGLVGLGAAKDLVLTARTITADEAHRLGLAQRVSRTGQALEDALATAAAIAGNDPAAVSYLKRLFSRFSGLDDRLAVENDALLALAEAGGDYTALTAPKPGVGSCDRTDKGAAHVDTQPPTAGSQPRPRAGARHRGGRSRRRAVDGAGRQGSG
jgi:enoyl-CoA hydratase/carnithine racemase